MLTLDFQSKTAGFGFFREGYENDIRKTLNQPDKHAMSGHCEYYKDRFIVKVHKDSDELFHGKYDTLFFEKVTPENEEELIPLTPDDWDVEWDEEL